MNGATHAVWTMKVSRNGTVSLPAEVRKRWNTDTVVITDLPSGLVVRPLDPDFVRSLMGKYRHLAKETVDEGRRAAREEEAEREEQRDRARRVRAGGVPGAGGGSAAGS